MVTISRAEYEKFQEQSEQISALEKQVAVLMEALRLARHKQFGASSEKSEDALMEQLSFLFNEAEVFSAAEKVAEENVTEVVAHKRHKKHEYILDNIPEGIPTKQVEHRLEGKELVCPECGDVMTEIGKEVVRTLEIIPAQTIVREDVYYYTYVCKTCGESADEGCETPIVKAPREKNIIPGSIFCQIQWVFAYGWLCRMPQSPERDHRRGMLGSCPEKVRRDYEVFAERESKGQLRIPGIGLLRTAVRH